MFFTVVFFKYPAIINTVLMSRFIKINGYLLHVFFAAALLLASCKGKEPEQKAVATVNDSPISLVELQKEVSLYSKLQPASRITSQSLEEHLKTMIEKKIMIQEAMKKGLAEDERFVETITKFWEQTLIRELINAKNKEWAERIYVTEDEIQKQYQRMQCTVTARVAKAKTRELAEGIRQKMLRGEHAEGEETVDSCFYEDVKLSALQNAFDMNSGEAKSFDSDGEYIVIYVVKNEKTALRPLKDLHDQIKESLLGQKKQKAMTDWMEELKKSSRININTELLKAAGNGK